MNDFDALYCIVLRITCDEENVEEELDNHSSVLGNIISNTYKDCFVIPVGAEIIHNDEDILKILNKFHYIDD